ncbi:MAG TPA: hypothetical protein VHN36_01745, partial [Ilumatobacteraceae bacterium]|nr:hypothetical protein [Ilumatobacteraceae bacterium]
FRCVASSGSLSRIRLPAHGGIGGVALGSAVTAAYTRRPAPQPPARRGSTRRRPSARHDGVGK